MSDGYDIELFASGLTLPSSLAFDNSGNLYVGVSGSETGYFSIYKVTPDGTSSLFGDAIPDPDGVAADSFGNVFVSGDGRITKIAPDGSSALFASGFSNLNGIAIDDSDNIFVADLGAGLINKVTSNGNISVLTSAVQRPSDIVFNSDDEMFVSDVGLNSILQVSPNGSVSTYYPLVGVPAFDSSGDLYLANPTLSSVGDILKITPEGEMSTFATGFEHPRGIVFDSSNNLFVTDLYAGKIYKISPVPEPSTILLLSTGLIGLAGWGRKRLKRE